MRSNFGYTRYQFDGEHWNLLDKGTFYTRAHSLNGIARAVKSINCAIAADRDVIVAYGYPDKIDKDKMVRIVWCPVIDYQEAFECERGNSTKDYDNAVVRCLNAVEGSFNC